MTVDERMGQIVARIDEIFRAFEDLNGDITTDDTVKGEAHLSEEMLRLKLEWERLNAIA